MISNNKKLIFSSKLIIIAASASLLCAAAYAHLRINGSEDYVGLLALLDHAFDAALVLGLCGVLLSVGHAAANGCGINFASTAEHISFSVFLGTGIVGLSMLCLGLLGLLRPWPVVTVLAFYITVSVHDLPDLGRVIRGGIRAATLTRETQVITLLFLCLIAILAFRAQTPPHSGDELIYHLSVTKQFVQQGRISADYDNSLGNMPFLVHMIYAICLIAGSDISAKLFSLFLAICTALTLYGFCSRFLTRRVGVMAMFVFFAAGMVVEVAITSRIDVSLAGMLFLATYSMMNYLKTDWQGWLWVSAIFGGFSLGIKHSAGLWLFFVGVMYFTEYVWFHNPVYPFFTVEAAKFGPHGVRYFNIDDERRLDAHFEVARKEIPEAVKAEEQNLRSAVSSRLPRHPMRLWEFFTEPNTYLMSEPYHFPNYLFLVIPVLLFLTKKRCVLWLLCISLAFIFTVTWTSWLARLLLPAQPPLTIVASYTLVNLSERLKESVSFVRKLPLYAIAIALSLTIITGCGYSAGKFDSLGFVTGRISRREFLRSLSNSEPINFINNSLPANARVMTIGVQMNYGIQRDYLTDETWFATKWRRLLVRSDSLEGVNEDLRCQGVTHIMFAPRLFILAAKWGINGAGGMDLIHNKQTTLSAEASRLGPEYQLLRNWATFTLYRDKFLESVYTDDNGYQILKLK